MGSEKAYEKKYVKVEKDARFREIEIPFDISQYLRSKNLSVQNLCRLCLSHNEYMVPLLSAKESGMLADMLSSFTSIQVHPEDGLPSQICKICKTQVINCYKFKMKCEQSDYTLKSTFKQDMNSLLKSNDKSIFNDDLQEQHLRDIKEEAHITDDVQYVDINLDNNKVYNQTLDSDIKIGAKDRSTETAEKNEDIQYMEALTDMVSDDETFCIVQHTGKRKRKKLKITITDSNEIFKEFVAQKKSKLKKSHKCTHCSKRFHKVISLKSHIRNIHCDEKFPYPCVDCNDFFSSEHDLILHSSLHNKALKWTCNKCNKQFQAKTMLRRHIQRHMQSKRYECESCGKSFAELYALRRHERVHTGEMVEKKHACHICGKRFSYSSLLATHMTGHSDARPWVCSSCGKDFPSARLLASHRLVHSDHKPYACIYCDKRFRHESTRNTHHRTHTGEKPYICATCGKTFIQNSNLTLHMRTHTGEKPYACSICERKFSSGSSLKNHQRTHTGEKPYTCTICGKGYSRIDMKAHMRLHTGERPYECSVCPKKFVSASRLRDHFRTHTGEKPFECATCTQKFATKTQLMKHIKSHEIKKKAEKRRVVVRKLDNDNNSVLFTNNTIENVTNETICEESNVVPLETHGELVVQDDSEIKTEILVVNNTQNNIEYQGDNICLTGGVTYVNNDGNFNGGDVNLVTMNEGEVSISASSGLLDGATVKLYQLDQSLVQIHSSGGQVTISKITSKMTANF